MERLPTELQTRILSMSAPDHVVPLIADLIEEVRNETLFRDLHLRQEQESRELAESTEPNSVMDLSIDTNAHKGLKRGAERFADSYANMAQVREQRRADLQFNLDAMKSIYYQHEMLINRAKRGQL